jgi:hypothetical protein
VRTTGKGWHSVVVIGGRKCGGEYYFLAQNFQRERVFFEVSSDYLRRSHVVLRFPDSAID